MKITKTAINIGISSVLVISGMTIDLFPNETSTIFSYQQVAGAQQGDAKILTATGTIIAKANQPQFDDTDGNGVISVSVGIDKFGNMVFSQIDEETAEKMKEKDGAQFNPKIKYKEDAIDLLTNTAQASISFGSTTAPIGFNCTACTSLTYPHVVSGTNPLLAIAVTDGGSRPATFLSGATYNGASTTIVGQQTDTYGDWVGLWYITGITGTNNVVLTASVAGKNIVAFSTSFDGMEQSSTLGGSGKAATASTDITVNVTTTCDNAWLVSSMVGNRTPSAGANTTIRSSNGANLIADSNGPKTPAGTYANHISQSDSTGAAIVTGAFCPYVASDPINRCMGTFVGAKLYCN